MLNDTLRSWTYYKRKLPLYMQNSYGIQEHFDILYNILINYDNTENNILKAFDIFDKDYENIVIRAYDEVDGYNFAFLDMLAKLYGVTRNFSVEYYDTPTSQTTTTKQLYLTNSELLKLIKARIIQNNYDGSYEQVRKFYDDNNFPISIFNSSTSGEAYVYLDRDNNFTENEVAMFKANLFTLKSMGIIYHTAIIDISDIGVWDATSTSQRWDSALWN